jgi:Delta7-sterol 5-desaturase
MEHLLDAQPSMFVVWLALTLGGIAIYFALSGLSYFIVFVLGRRRFHPSYVGDPAKNRQAMRLSVVGVAGNITLSMPFHGLIAAGYSRLYWDPSHHGVPWLVASALLYIAFVDTMIYWVHRAMHHKLLYRRFHRQHHQWRVPNSWTSMAFHPVDSFANAAAVHLFGFLVPLNGWLYLAMQGAMTLWSLGSHDRVALVRWRWFNYVDNHTLHHWFFRCNYGQFFTFWDRIMGTWRDPAMEAQRGRVPEGVLR